MAPCHIYIYLWTFLVGLYPLITTVTTLMMSAKSIGKELPHLYDKDKNITQDLYAKSVTQCSTYCIKTNCTAFMFKYDGVADDQHCYRTSNYYDYTGTVNNTITGRTCQNWASQFPHTHLMDIYVDNFPEKNLATTRNYCRDPDRTGYNWCYTTDPNSRWEFCDVSKCLDIGKNCRLYQFDAAVNTTVTRTGYNFYRLNGV